jgi:dinuclear metal center YbgI/SA1388 family protein
VQIKDITNYLETIAPLALQENYDNSGLIVGNKNTEVTQVLISLDCTEAIVEEAIERRCNLIVSHHPIVFSGLKRLNGSNYIERTVIKAIQNNIAIYAIHTNLDNVLHNGVNQKIAEKLGLENTKILTPKSDTLYKIVTFCPVKEADNVRNAIFSAGAGVIGNYNECSFNIDGEGTFKANKDAIPYVGEHDKRHTENEVRIETIFPTHLQNAVVSALLNAHPYEEVAYDIYPIKNQHPKIGAGIIGELSSPMEADIFLSHLKNNLKAEGIRYTSFNKPIKKVAVCGGSGSFLLNDAIRQNADAFVTGDFKYHQFFDAENRLMIADVGHFESEQFTIELLGEILTKKFTNFAVLLTKVNTNPIKYYK